jgi:phosphatidylinositol 3,5-bisphosphate 5-phosphatase
LLEIARHLACDLKKTEGQEGSIEQTDLVVLLSKLFVTKCYGIIGFPRFLDAPYIHLILKKKLVGTVVGCNVYTIADARLEILASKKMSCLYQSGKLQQHETKYLSYFNQVEMSKQFYFSYGIDLTRSLQTTISNYKDPTNPNKANGRPLGKSIGSPEKVNLPGRQCQLDINDRFVWNTHILQDFVRQKDVNLYELILPIIHGYYIQKVVKFGSRVMTLGVISRRSRFHFGPRYLKRGINSEGDTANEVETEQFLVESSVFEEKKVINVASYVYFR